jgi:hypothetical protein
MFPDKPGRHYRCNRDLVRYCNNERMSLFAFEMANQGIYVLERGMMSLSEPMTNDALEKIIATTKGIVESILA